MIALLIIAAVCSHEPWKDMHERGQWSHTVAITSNNNLWLLSKQDGQRELSQGETRQTLISNLFRMDACLQILMNMTLLMSRAVMCYTTSSP